MVLEFHISEPDTVSKAATDEVPTHPVRRRLVAINEGLIGGTEGSRVTIPFVVEFIEHFHLRADGPVQFAQQHGVLESTWIEGGKSGEGSWRGERDLLALLDAFAVHEEEQFVFNDGAAETSTEVIPLIIGILIAGKVRHQ